MRRNWMLVCALLSVCAHAATLDEDEARIAELIRAEEAAGQTARQAPARIVTKAAPVAAPIAASVVAPAATPHDDWLASPPNRAGVPLSELPQHIGQRVSITTTNERVHRGVLGSADSREVTVRVKKPGGSATYTLSRTQIVRVDLR